MWYELFSNLFKGQISSMINQVRLAALQESREERDKSRRFEAEHFIGKKVIIVGEDNNPVIGIVQSLMPDNYSNVPVVLNYLTMEENICFGKIYPFDIFRMTAIFKLTPTERWILACQYCGTREIENYGQVILTFEQAHELLKTNGFFQEDAVKEESGHEVSA